MLVLGVEDRKTNDLGHNVSLLLGYGHGHGQGAGPESLVTPSAATWLQPGSLLEMQIPRAQARPSEPGSAFEQYPQVILLHTKVGLENYVGELLGAHLGEDVGS